MKSFVIGIILFFVLIIGGGITLASLDTKATTQEVTKTIALPDAGQSR